MPDELNLDRLLLPTATVAERSRGLLSLLPPHVFADAVGVKASSLRNWASGQSRPRPHAAVLLDDLRAAAKVLVDGGLDAGRVSAWLTSRDPAFWDGMRPVEAIRFDPMDVLAAAHGVVLDEQAAESALGEHNGNGHHRRKGDRPLELVAD